MVFLSEILDVDLLEKYILDGYVNRRLHPDGELAILNYSAKCQYEQKWDNVTTQTRGLIYHILTGRVISRPWKKFFNYNDSTQPYPPTGPCLRTSKVDGSLGILYPDSASDCGWSVATRGSFTSDQAIFATELLNQWAREGKVWPREFISERTYLTEIVFPENRIVVDYGDMKSLVLLDILDIDTCRPITVDFEATTWPDKVSKKAIAGFRDTMVSDIPQGAEGFVFYWPRQDFRCKMKAVEYLELHRMIFGLNERVIWQRMRDGETVADIAEKMPDEFHEWINGVAADLTAKSESLIKEANKQYSEVKRSLPDEYSRKEFAQLAVKHSLKSYLFMIEDGRKIDQEVWKALRPVGGKTFSTINEDVS